MAVRVRRVLPKLWDYFFDEMEKMELSSWFHLRHAKRQALQDALTAHEKREEADADKEIAREIRLDYVES